MAACPSYQYEIRNNGTTATKDAHTMKRSISIGPADLVMIFETPHINAAAITNRKPSVVMEASCCSANNATPATATRMATICLLLGLSLKIKASRNMVKKTWVCRSSEANPADIPMPIPMKRSENFTTPKETPKPVI
jgi:hypothetical protein